MNLKLKLQKPNITLDVGLLVILLISLIPLIPLFHAGLPQTHDGQDHVARIANFYRSLSEGNFVPRWAQNLNWGYGHPILMFLYPLPSYAASLFHFLGFSFVDSYKVVMGGGFILSGVFMYIWLCEFLDDSSSLVGALLYNFAPYRFVDFYVRGAIGEHVAFIFLPLVLYFLLKISKEDKKNYLNIAFASLSFAALILSHNALLIMFLPFIIFYAIFLIATNKNKKSITGIYLAVIAEGFALSTFFILPAFVEGKYTLRDIVTGNEALSRFVDFKNIIYSSWSYGGSGEFSVQLGVLQWIGIFFSPIVLYKLSREKKTAILYIATFIYLISSIFIMLPASAFIWSFVTVLKKFQFPWRFLSASVFAAAALGAFFVSVQNKIGKKLILTLIVVAVLFINRQFWQPKGYIVKPESFYTGIYNGTTDTGESAPIWSVRFMEKKPSAYAEVIAGSAVIKDLSRTSTSHKYEIVADYRSRIRENTLYFPGWTVYIDNKEYKGLQFQDPANRGLMTFYVQSGRHEINVKFQETRLRQISNFVSIIAAILLGSIIILKIGYKSVLSRS